MSQICDIHLCIIDTMHKFFTGPIDMHFAVLNCSTYPHVTELSITLMTSFVPTSWQRSGFPCVLLSGWRNVENVFNFVPVQTYRKIRSPDTYPHFRCEMFARAACSFFLRQCDLLCTSQLEHDLACRLRRVVEPMVESPRIQEC